MPSKLARGSVMNSKKCSECEVVKPLDEFRHRKDSKDGRRNNCKECQDEYQKQYRQDNPKKIKERGRQYYQDNKEELNERNRQYYRNNIEKIEERHRQWRKDNKEKRSEYINKYIKNKYHNDPAFRFMMNISRQVRHMLNRAGGSKNGESVEKHLSYTKKQLWDHLRSLYTEGMTDDNYGEWEIDHIYPHSKLPYDSMTDPNFQKVWALDNLQPLWASDNRSKGAKIINE